jgi:hypothetical protein
MHKEENITTNRRIETGAGKGLQHQLTRRRLLRGAAGLGASWLALGVASPSLAGPGQWRPPITADQHRAEVATAWFRLVLQLAPTTPGLSVLPVGRAFGYLGVTLYEALVGGILGAESFAGRLNELSPVPGHANRAYHWPSVANSALATSMRELFRMTTDENKAIIDELERSQAERLAAQLPPGIAAKSVARGRKVADHIMSWATTDGGHDGHLTNFPLDYTPPAGPGLWVPTPPGFQGAYQPYWGSNRPIALPSVDDDDPGPPPDFSTDPASAFYGAELEVYQTVNALTDEQLAIALHWANPHTHHLSLVTQAVEAQHADLARAAEAFAKGGIAVYDAQVACWHMKFRYNMIRPISYIQEHIDASWGNPLPVTTPPHPDYTAAHPVVTRSMVQVVYDLFGDFPFTDHTWAAIGLPPRSYNSWFALAEENGISRLYGGIHSRPAIEAGLEQGRRIGERVSAL